MQKIVLIRIFLAILPLSVGCAGYNNPVEALFSGNNIDNNGIDRQRLPELQDLECCLLQFSSKVLKKSAATSHGSNLNGGSIDLLLKKSPRDHSIQSKSKPKGA